MTSTRVSRPIVSIMVLSLTGCGSPEAGPATNGGAPAEPSSPTELAIPAVGLAYLLQPEALSTAAIAATGFAWLILEPSRTGTADGDFTRGEIEAIRTTGPCGGKTVLAYLSVGEAEEFRDYWNPDWIDEQGRLRDGVAPGWLGPSNPDFPDNYKVRYWDPQWQAIILGTADGSKRTPLDRILDAGFDGVYLDIIDAYEFWSSAEGDRELTRAEARERMIAWVVRIGDYARVTRGVEGFLVFPQNASDIIRTDDDELDGLSEAFFAAIDGIGIEDLFYDGATRQPGEEVDYRMDQLREFARRGKTVLVTDYLLRSAFTPQNSDARMAEFYARTLDAGFIPYAAVEDRDLDEVVVLDSPPWSVAQPPPDCGVSP